MASMQMREHHIDEVREIYGICHPTWPTHSAWWYRAMHTEVIEVKRRVVAFAVLSLAPPPAADRLPADALCGWLIDTCVLPEHRGAGYASLLMDKRLDIAYLAGAQMAIGAAHKSNEWMVKILLDRDFKLAQPNGNRFPDGLVGDVYIKHLGGHRVSTF